MRDAEFELEPPVNPPVPPPAFSAHDAFVWPHLIRALDKAGYRIVKKPELIGKGLPAAKKK